jgi:hypothetical protein
MNGLTPVVDYVNKACSLCGDRFPVFDRGAIAKSLLGAFMVVERNVLVNRSIQLIKGFRTL